MAQFIQINVAAAGTLNNGAFLVQVDQIENIVQTASTTTVITLIDATTFTLTHTASSPVTTPTAKNAIVSALTAAPSGETVLYSGPAVSGIVIA
tara:strand:- start:105 stop:386 length:282 start_codon:yes stop_codon:yes gene_type:complete